MKESFDEFDFHLSPLGSLYNLYESILPKSDDPGQVESAAQAFHFYDPVSGHPPKCPSSASDGYLEPVASQSQAATEGERLFEIEEEKW